MTREIRYREAGRAPRYLDHGHIARKAVYWSALTLLLPVGLLAVTASSIGRLGDWLDDFAYSPMSRLRVWSHPCLYRRKS